MSADSYADLLERLVATYEDRHSLAAIKHITAQGRTELVGQTPPGALLELLERLAGTASTTFHHHTHLADPILARAFELRGG